MAQSAKHQPSDTSPTVPGDVGLGQAPRSEAELGFVTESGAVSAQGLGRKRNEDAVLCALPTLAVADGVGGRRAGHLAAWLAVGALAGSYEGDPATVLRRVFDEANTAIRLLAEGELYAGAATTLTCARFVPGGIWVAHVGDSRAYRARGENLEQLTTDHSLVEELRRTGAISSAQARRHPMRSVIIRGLGVAERVRPDLVRVELLPGDAVLLCTDGLSKSVRDSEIAAELSAPVALTASLGRLVAIAQERGGDDVTVAAARMAAV